MEHTEVIRDVGGIRKRHVMVDRVTFPDGLTRDFDPGQASREILNHFRMNDPAPLVPTLDYNTWRSGRATVTTRAAWEASLFCDGECQPISIQQQDSQYGLPIEEVLATINTLANEGWIVVQVSEDRGLSRGETLNYDGWVTRARYLLARDRS